MTNRVVFSLAISCVSLPALAIAMLSGPWKSVVPETVYPKLMDAEIGALKSALDTGIGEKKIATRAKNNAMMIAALAQSAMLGTASKAAQRAGLRDLALQIAKAIDDNKAADAKSLAQQLSANADSLAGKTAPLDLNKNYDLEDLMQQFKPERGHGKDLEKKIKALMQKRAALSPAELTDGVCVAYQTALIAQFTEAMAPDDSGNKKKSDWVNWSAEMGTLAVDAAKAASAAKPDDKAVKAAFRKLDDNCTKCHQVFRDNN